MLIHVYLKTMYTSGWLLVVGAIAAVLSHMYSLYVLFFIGGIVEAMYDGAWWQQLVLISGVSAMYSVFVLPFHRRVAMQMPSRKRTLIVLQLASWLCMSVVLFSLAYEERRTTEAKALTVLYDVTSTACHTIFYDIVGAPELKLKERTLTYTFSEERVLATASPATFGWRTKTDIGRQELLVYVNGQKQASSDVLTIHGVYKHVPYQLISMKGSPACDVRDVPALLEKVS